MPQVPLLCDSILMLLYLYTVSVLDHIQHWKYQQPILCFPYVS